MLGKAERGSIVWLSPITHFYGS